MRSRLCTHPTFDYLCYLCMALCATRYILWLNWVGFNKFQGKAKNLMRLLQARRCYAKIMKWVEIVAVGEVDLQHFGCHGNKVLPYLSGSVTSPAIIWKNMIIHFSTVCTLLVYSNSYMCTTEGWVFTHCVVCCLGNEWAMVIVCMCWQENCTLSNDLQPIKIGTSDFSFKGKSLVKIMTNWLKFNSVQYTLNIT